MMLVMLSVKEMVNGSCLRNEEKCKSQIVQSPIFATMHLLVPESIHLTFNESTSSFQVVIMSLSHDYIYF